VATADFSMIIKRILNSRINLVAISHLHVKGIFFILFLAVYFVTEINNLSSRNLNDYPFGGDIPHYTFDIGHIFRHPLTTWLIKSYRGLIEGMFHVTASIPAMKFLFSFFGAINIVIVYSICTMFFNRYRSVLYTACYGFSLSVWYFSSVPESYVISATLYSLYIWYFIKHSSDLRLTQVLISLGILTLALLNDISSVFLLLLPLTYYNKKIITDKKIRRFFLLHVFFFLASWFVIKFQQWPLVEFYSNMRNDFSVKSFMINDFMEPLLNVTFFSIGAPSHEVSYAPRMLPHYPGYFVPSLWGYMNHIVTAIFFVFYSGFIMIALSRIHLIKHNKFIIPFIIFIIARYVSIIFVNPGEAFLFTILSTLPLLLVLFFLFDMTNFKYKGIFEFILTFSIAASNLRFFIY